MDDDAFYTGVANSLTPGESKGDYGAANLGSGKGSTHIEPGGQYPDGVVAYGNYQFQKPTWNEAMAALNLDGKTTNENQDAAAKWLIKQQGVNQNDTPASIVSKLNGRWPSLPGGSQQNTSMNQYMNNYNTAMAAANTPSDDDLINRHQQLYSPTPTSPSPTGAPTTSVAPEDSDLINRHQQLYAPLNSPTSTPGMMNGQPATVNSNGTFTYNNETAPASNPTEAYNIPKTTLQPGQVETPQPTVGESIAAAPGAVVNAFKEGYNNTPSIVPGSTNPLVRGFNAGTGVVNGLGQAIGQEVPYQIGNAIGGPRLGQDLVGLTTAAAIGTGGMPKWQTSELSRIGQEAQTPFPQVIPAKIMSDKIPNQPLTPAAQVGATPTMIAEEAALRAKFPTQFKAIDNQVDTTNMNHLQDALGGKIAIPGYQASGKPILNQSVMDKLFNNDPKSPEFNLSLMADDGKTIDPVKYNAWLDNINNAPPKFGGLKGAPNFQPHVLDALENVRDSVNRQATIDDATEVAKANGGTALNDLGSTPVQRYLAQNGGYSPVSSSNLGAEILGGLAEYGIRKGAGISPIGPALGYGLGMLKNQAAKVYGPKVAAGNQAAISDLLDKSTQPLPPKYQLGKILPTP